MNSKPIVSVIIPCYKVGIYLSKLLKTISINDYIEYIFVDDATPDKATKRILDGIEGYKVLVNKKNIGISATRNKGIKAAKGEFIFFLDGDDLFIEENMLNFIKTNKMRENIYRFNLETFKNSNKEIKTVRKPFLKKKTLGRGDLFYSCQMSSFLLKKEFLKDNDLYFPVDLLIEDLFFLFKLVMTNEKQYYINKAVAKYRLERPGSITESDLREQKIVNKYFMKALEFFDDPRIIVELYKDLIKQEREYGHRFDRLHRKMISMFKFRWIFLHKISFYNKLLIVRIKIFSKKQN